MITILKILNELTLQQYINHQIAVAKIVAKRLKMTEDDLITKTNFAEVYAKEVDRNKDFAPSINSIASKIENQLQV